MESGSGAESIGAEEKIDCALYGVARKKAKTFLEVHDRFW
jgi:hypothetical protein